MIFQWYLLFNLVEFTALGLISRTINAQLDGIGVKEILITHGNETSIVYADVFLPVEFKSDNPFTRIGSDGKTYGVYKDADENVWLGIQKS